MPDKPEFGSEAWFVARSVYGTNAKPGDNVHLDIEDPLRTAVAEALEWAADHTGLFMTKGRDFRKGSEIIRAKAKEIRNG